MNSESRKRSQSTVDGNPSGDASMTPPSADRASSATRRGFLKGGGLMLAGGAIGTALSMARGAHAYGSDTIRVGLIGCGARGTRAAMESLATPGGDVKLVALADVFANNLHTCYRTINGRHRNQVDVGDRRFVGLDAFDAMMQTDVDVVILATPPAFRPLHFEAAVASGKHVFMERPIAVDAVGAQRVHAAGQRAAKRRLAVQVGLQRRHELRYQQTVQQLHRGLIGDPMFGRAYWNTSAAKFQRRQPKETELEFQLRNWHAFTWLSGDSINALHIQNLDVINWILGEHPIEAQGQGGQCVSSGSRLSQTFDHHMVEFTYPGGFKLFSQSRQVSGCWNHTSEYVHGTEGMADLGHGLIRDRDGRVIWQCEAKEIKGKGWQQEQNDLFAALRRGDVPNEVDAAVASTMTAIMGRTATYTGTVIKWPKAIADQQPLAEPDLLHGLDDPAPVHADPEGRYPVARPGTTSPNHPHA